MKKNFFALFLMLPVTLISAGVAHASNYNVHLVTYERNNAKNSISTMIENDKNPVFNPGSRLDFKSFNNFINTDKRAVSFNDSRITVGNDGETLTYFDTHSFTFAGLSGEQNQEIWLGQKLDGKFYSDSGDRFSMKLNYQYHYAKYDVEEAADFLKKGNVVKTIAFNQELTVVKDSVNIISTCLAKNGNTRYLAVYITEIVAD